MTNSPSVHAGELRHRGFVNIFNVPLSYLFPAFPQAPVKPIFFYIPSGTIAVDECCYQWVCFKKFVDLSDLYFKDTTYTIPQLSLEPDILKRN